MPDTRLIDFQQSVRRVEGSHYDVVTFSGADPILVRSETKPAVIIQAGRAVAWGAIMIAPAAIFPTLLVAQPEVEVRRIDETQYETVWRYAMAVDEGSLPLFAAFTGWPASPQFESV